MNSFIFSFLLKFSFGLAGCDFTETCRRCFIFKNLNFAQRLAFVIWSALTFANWSAFSVAIWSTFSVCKLVSV